MTLSWPKKSIQRFGPGHDSGTFIGSGPSRSTAPTRTTARARSNRLRSRSPTARTSRSLGRLHRRVGRGGERKEVDDLVRFYLRAARMVASDVGCIPLPPRLFELARQRFVNLRAGSAFQGVRYVLCRGHASNDRIRVGFAPREWLRRVRWLAGAARGSGRSRAWTSRDGGARTRARQGGARASLAHVARVRSGRRHGRRRYRRRSDPSPRVPLSGRRGAVRKYPSARGWPGGDRRLGLLPEAVSRRVTVR